MSQKIIAAMSGGVDSSATALLLLENGFSVSGATMRLLHTTAADQDIRDAAGICRQLGIEHTVYDLTSEFSQYVISNFISVYESGYTPNPCIVCNKYLKFGALLDAALDNGADGIATGHYARITYDGNRFLLKRALDIKKDQSYVLWTLSQDQLSRSHFPLGHYKKSDIRELSSAHGLITAHKSDSQDICFVKDGKYAEFIERETGRPDTPGKFVDTSGNILGKHRGIIHYTVGQRKGLGISFGQPMFVGSKNAVTREIMLCGNDELFTRELYVHDLNLIATDRLNGEVRAEVKIRYAQTASLATVIQLDHDRAKIIFDEPQRAVAPGQSAVMYDSDTVIGGGIIE